MPLTDDDERWGFSVAWLSFNYDSERVVPDNSYRANQDLVNDPAWHQWLTTYVTFEENLDPYLFIDDVDERSLKVHRRNREGERDVTATVPVAEFQAGRPEREVLREIFAWVFGELAQRFGWEAPPPVPLVGGGRPGGRTAERGRDQHE